MKVLVRSDSPLRLRSCIVREHRLSQATCERPSSGSSTCIRSCDPIVLASLWEWQARGRIIEVAVDGSITLQRFRMQDTGMARYLMRGALVIRYIPTSSI